MNTWNRDQGFASGELTREQQQHQQQQHQHHSQQHHNPIEPAASLSYRAPPPGHHSQGAGQPFNDTSAGSMSWASTNQHRTSQLQSQQPATFNSATILPSTHSHQYGDYQASVPSPFGSYGAEYSLPASASRTQGNAQALGQVGRYQPSNAVLHTSDPQMYAGSHFGSGGPAQDLFAPGSSLLQSTAASMSSGTDPAYYHQSSSHTSNFAAFAPSSSDSDRSTGAHQQHRYAPYPGSSAGLSSELYAQRGGAIGELGAHAHHYSGGGGGVSGPSYGLAGSSYGGGSFHEYEHRAPPFFNPFEVKHRRRTTRSQFKVLESTFSQTPKPSAATRKALSEQLDMPLRAVQIWFQNRRAKAKAQTKKLDGPIGKGQEQLNQSSQIASGGQDFVPPQRSVSTGSSGERPGSGDSSASMMGGRGPQFGRIYGTGSGEGSSGDLKPPQSVSSTTSAPGRFNVQQQHPQPNEQQLGLSGMHVQQPSPTFIADDHRRFASSGYLVTGYNSASHDQTQRYGAPSFAAPGHVAGGDPSYSSAGEGGSQAFQQGGSRSMTFPQPQSHAGGQSQIRQSEGERASSTAPTDFFYYAHQQQQGPPRRPSTSSGAFPGASQHDPEHSQGA